MPRADPDRTRRPHPGPEQELALLLCQTARARERYGSAIEQVVRRVDFDELASFLFRNGLLTICGRRLKEIVGDALPASFEWTIDRVGAVLRAGGMLHETVTTSLLQDLEWAGIQALPLKGALLARRIYGDTSTRPACDIDILVSRAELIRARSVIESHNYITAPEPPFVEGLPNLHYTMSSVNGELPEVELHWRIHWYEDGFSERMLERSVLDDAGIRHATPVDELAGLLLFYQRDSFLGLKLAADVAAWWDTYSGQLHPTGLGSVAQQHPELHDALLASARVVERLVQIPVTGLLSASPRRVRRTAWAARLGDWSYGDMTPQAIANLGLIDWLLTPPRGRLAYARRYFWQPYEVFARDYGLSGRPRLRDRIRQLGHAVARAAKSQAYLCRALWRIRAGRLWTPLPHTLLDGSAMFDGS